jgi:hypothetical protein
MDNLYNMKTTTSLTFDSKVVAKVMYAGFLFGCGACILPLIIFLGLKYYFNRF